MSRKQKTLLVRLINFTREVGAPPSTPRAHRPHSSMHTSSRDRVRSFFAVLCYEQREFSGKHARWRIIAAFFRVYFEGNAGCGGSERFSDSPPFMKTNISAIISSKAKFTVLLGALRRYVTARHCFTCNMKGNEELSTRCPITSAAADRSKDVNCWFFYV